jgi:hypothetical protein
MRKLEEPGERMHQRIWELLPWYTNGSLAERESEMVTAHLAVCPRCEAEALTCQRTAEELRAVGEAAPSPHPVQLQRVLARIDESEREEGAGGGAWGRGAWSTLAAAARGPLRGALVAQAAAILLLVGLLAWRESSRPAPEAAPPAVYRTLSDPAAAPAPAVDLRVMFAPQASEREIRGLLLGIHVQITAGPSRIGVYTIEIPADGDPVAVVLARLRSEPQVAFAEPAVSPGEASDGP